MYKLFIGVIFFGLLQALPVLASDVPNIFEIAGKTRAEVSKKLDSSPQCKPTKYGVKCIYKKPSIEIIFIKDKADWITVNNLEYLPFNESSLVKLGFPPRPPVVNNREIIKWTRLKGAGEVSFFKGTTGIDYAYIKVFSE